MPPRVHLERLRDALSPWDALRRVHRPDEGVALLDACPRPGLTAAEQELRRYSFLAAAPTRTLTARGPEAHVRDGDGGWTRLDEDPLTALHRFHESRVDAPEGAPPFLGGALALVTYDAGRLLERLPTDAADDTDLPWVHAFRFDAALAWNHADGAVHLAWLDTPAGDAAARTLRERLQDAPAPVHPLPKGLTVASNTGRKGFERMVRAAKQYVRDGDVFQVNLSHRLTGAAPADPLSVYARLREANAAPFAAFFQSGPRPDGEPFHVLSTSPERLFQLHDRTLEARPIAGTRPRGATPEADKALAHELLESEKDRAEHVMLVDLARNDLGRVATYGSVHVKRLLAVETYRRVHHLVSVVVARLKGDLDGVDALRALFPGGTITGAPKVRSMEIIDELEPARRGPYTGSLGYVSHGGTTDFNILIRTLVLEGGRMHLQVGAGIVEDSDPAHEWEETLAKARALLEGLGIDTVQEEPEASA